MTDLSNATPFTGLAALQQIQTFPTFAFHRLKTFHATLCPKSEFDKDLLQLTGHYFHCCVSFISNVSYEFISQGFPHIRGYLSLK